MQIHLTSLQLLSFAIAFVIVTFLATLALVAEIERRRKPPLLLDYVRLDFERELPRQDPLTERDELNAFIQHRIKAYESRKSITTDGNRE
ncbi:MAG: hypothetical protein WA802_16915 [Terracidiphilus sp.]